ncbi:related to PPR1 - Zinc finger transcription factor [Melanopsichium pennsylvanicum]|uniref:Related to PPR1 - Zinc finger transcription factor n=2 Tax=Melanopsichium pennsylvanicum TaxID=63383 RepID=A0AAJ5C418_9BASI
MSTGGLAPMRLPGHDDLPSFSTDATASNTAKQTTNSTSRASGSNLNAFSATAGPSRSSLETSVKQIVDKKQDRERSTSKDKERESRLPACEACRTRKVKCDALLPACTPCQKSGRECFGRDKVPNVSRGLVYELQQKVKDLERRLALTSSGADNHSASREGDISDSPSASGRRILYAQRPPAKRAKRGRDWQPSLNDGVESVGSDEESSSSESSSSSVAPADPSPNDFIQQTSTILESLSSDLTGSAQRHHQPTLSRSTTQTLDNDEASALTALTRHHRDRTKSPQRYKRPSSSNASKHRDEAGSYFASASYFKNAATSFPFKSRSRSGRFGTISAYDRSFFDRLIARYLTYMNTALPVFIEARMWEMASVVYQDDERSRLAAMSARPFDIMPPPPLPSSPNVDRMTLSKHRYVVLMALAIALGSLGRSHNFSPELRRLGHQYWAEAQGLFPVLFRFGDIDKLRAILLQLQYALLVPTAGSVWELSGAAIRLVTELNLHVDREYDSASDAPLTQEIIDLRRRLFWTAYCLDRSLAVALARPPGLSDAWIHVQLPTLLPDTDLLRPDRDHSSSSQGNARVDAQKQIFRSLINLRRIQSEILCRLHSVNPRDYSLDSDGVSQSQTTSTRPSLALVMEVGPPTPNVEWQTRMMEKLVEWRTQYDQIRLIPPTIGKSEGDGASSTATPFITREWIDLTHNLTISLLFRPSPNNPRPDSHGLQQAFMASGRAMKIYKSMHRSSIINFPWLATHHLFISGLTHLNALEKLTRTGCQCPSPVVEVVFNVQSCASTLEALTSRDDGYGTKIRDTFDAAASAVLRTVLDPSGSTRGGTSAGGDDLDVASVDDFIRSTAPAAHNKQTPIPPEHSSMRMLHHAAQSQHPTWLSDSTWSSLNTLHAAPPPGSTILVAAPPRTARFGRPESSLVPTLSERTTQSSVHSNAGVMQNSGLAALQQAAMDSPRAYTLQTAGTYSSNLTPSGLHFATKCAGYTGGGSCDPFQLHTTASNTSNGNSSAFDISGMTQKDTSSSGSNSAEEPNAAERSATAFGFHNWLLQPYEGGADSLGAFSSSVSDGNPFAAAGVGGMLFGTSSASPSNYSAEPFHSNYTTSDVTGTASGSVHGAYTTPATKGGSEGQTDASTLLDFLSMLPETTSSSASPSGKQSQSQQQIGNRNGNGSPAHKTT